MADLSDMERLRAQNLSLLNELRKGQRDLRSSVRSAVATRGSHPKQSVVLQEKPTELNVRFQRDPLNLSTMSLIRHKRTGDVPRSRLTSTPKYTSSSAKAAARSDAPDQPFPPRPAVDPLLTDTPNRLYESFLSESNSAFGRGIGKPGKALTRNPSGRKTPGSVWKGKGGSMKRKSYTPRKSPKPRSGAGGPVFTPSPSDKEPQRPHSVQLETSSLLPPPVSDRVNRRGRGSRYGYRRPLDLAHEESYYQLNRDSPGPRGTGAHVGQLGSSFAGQLLADGNDRQQMKRGREVTARPKSILLTPGTRMNKSRNKVSFRRPPSPSATLCPDDSLANRTQPLLGYDWIAGLLDSDSPANEHSEVFFEELRQFRQANREECIHKSMTEEPNASASFQMTQTAPDDPEDAVDAGKHTCIHNYTLNPRLFAVPLHGAQNGESLCAICNDRRKPTQLGASSPSYIRVSIPRSTLASPYRIRPHRRKSYDPTDSVGLSQHCLAGWESSKPSMLPTASNIDLKDSVDKMASNALNLMSYPSQEPSYRSEKASRISKHTQDLLNRSHALQLDLQKLERVGMSVARLPSQPHSTTYPVL